MNTAIVMGELCPNEILIRSNAQNLKHLLDFAEKTLLIAPDIQIPPFTSILNAVCTCFGYRSVKGMQTRLKEPAEPVNIFDLPALDLMPALRNANSAQPDTALMPVNLMAERLLSELLTQPDSEMLGTLLSRIKPYRLHPLTAQALQSYNAKGNTGGTLLLTQVIKSAVDSVMIASMWLEGYSIETKIPLNSLIKTPASQPALLKELGAALRHQLRHLSQDNVVVSCQILQDEIGARYNYFAAGFCLHLTCGLRNGMIASLKLDPATQQSARILQNLSLTPAHQNAERLLLGRESDYSTSQNNPNHPDFALLVIGEMAQALMKLDEMILSELDGTLYAPSMHRHVVIDLFEWDAYGLLTTKGLIDMFDHINRSLINSVGQKRLNSRYFTPNALYWVLQIASTVLLKTRGTAHAHAAIRLIQDAYKKHGVTAPVWEMSRETSGDAFEQCLNEMIAMIHANLSSQLNQSLSAIRGELFGFGHN